MLDIPANRDDDSWYPLTLGVMGFGKDIGLDVKGALCKPGFRPVLRAAQGLAP